MRVILLLLVIFGPPCGATFGLGYMFGRSREMQRTIDYEQARLARYQAHFAATRTGDSQDA